MELLRPLFARTIRVGDSYALLGAFDIVVVSKPFTAGEDAVLAWVQAQDDCTVADFYPLPDGRDFIHLRRLHTRQSVTDAISEQARFVTACLIAT